MTLNGFKCLVVAALMLSSTLDANAASQSKWVEVTKPVIYCGGVDADAAAFLLLRWLSSEHGEIDDDIKQSCGLLTVGDQYLLDDQQPESDRSRVILMWSPICPRGCSPTMLPAAAPPRRLAGTYLKPIKPPKGWEGW
ncbi:MULTISPECIES: hypothetical protein [unclassified Mesorhizobium]|uniref:hypothetical protein n=1 Tax=unclassified Mesorhizobium TaxID=325217 RepID=UPI000FD8D97E|nr:MULTISPECIES: hypothetical protein [unclassified Mesorhizobium]TGQ17122.1 hypothetical protein EN862_006515 [Mesorhizobium sp. M2E.F.Ca.ET.219.01.1.1]TGT76783.1 hypothetical protein EN809_004045 [Mesorhizobium sp. M2E.F.Ca.ET.166.01.1.1]TGW02895.1 hypothetical protein EN797_004045 [Mesorhizobium sp. M2E.F.Ca.ET.154.01.1.1]